MNYYNENNPYVAQWLRNLIGMGLIPAGNVDERDIREVQPADLREYTQCHFFAGIAGWSRALELAGWPEDQEVWTGSCPCQPFSVAGKKKGEADERHLWPVWYELIKECRPSTLFGEQVGSPAGRKWFSGVRSDLEAAGYAVGGADLPAACVNSPHLRQRLWWVGKSHGERQHGEQVCIQSGGSQQESVEAARSSGIGRVANSEVFLGGRPSSEVNSRGRFAEIGGPSAVDGMGDSNSEGGRGDSRAVPRKEEEGESRGEAVRCESNKPEPTSFWDDFDVVRCKDGKSRRVKSGTQSLAYWVPARVGKLSAYGNAICPQVAAQFIMAYQEAIAELT